MTMHLARGLTTINTKKRKKKPLTQTQIEKYTVQWRQYNKSMRQKNMHDLQYKTLEDYIAYVRGEARPRSKQDAVTSYKPETTYRRESQDIPSYVSKGGFAPCTKKETPKYTGDLIVGIATMHKSNLVPIMRGTKQAEEIARMRR